MAEPDLRISVVDDGVHLHQTDPTTPAATVRRELLILANALAGSFCEEHDLAALYRVESAPIRCLVEGAGLDPVACFAQRKLMPMVTVQVDPEPHHGLGVARCAPVTAATDSYIDLLVQQQIVHFLQTGQARYTRDEIADAFYASRTAWEQADAIEESARRYWLLKHLEQRPQRKVEAVVLDRSPSGSMVRLCETQLDTFLPLRQSRPQVPGDRIWVAVISVSARRNILRVRTTQ